MIEEVLLALQEPPQHDVVVALEFEERLEGGHVVGQGEDPLEVAEAVKLLLALEEQQPVLGREHLDAVGVAEFLDGLDVLGVDLAADGLVGELVLGLLLQLLLLAVLDADEVEDVGEEGVLDLAVHGRGGAERGADVHLHEPGLEAGVEEDVEAVDFEAAGPLLLGLGVQVEHVGLGRNARLDDHFLDAPEHLHKGRATCCASMPTLSKCLRRALSDHLEPSPSTSALELRTNRFECLLTLKLVRCMKRLRMSLSLQLYSQVAKRTSPSSKRQTRRGSQLVTSTYSRRSYFSPLIRCGLLTYSDTRYSFRFLSLVSLLTILMPRPQAAAAGFRIHSWPLSAFSRATWNRSKSAGSKQVTGRKLKASGWDLLILLTPLHRKSLRPMYQQPGKWLIFWPLLMCSIFLSLVPLMSKYTFHSGPDSHFRKPLYSSEFTMHLYSDPWILYVRSAFCTASTRLSSRSSIPQHFGYRKNTVEGLPSNLLLRTYTTFESPCSRTASSVSSSISKLMFRASPSIHLGSSAFCCRNFARGFAMHLSRMMSILALPLPGWILFRDLPFCALTTEEEKVATGLLLPPNCPPSRILLLEQATDPRLPFSGGGFPALFMLYSINQIKLIMQFHFANPYSPTPCPPSPKGFRPKGPGHSAGL